MMGGRRFHPFSLEVSMRKSTFTLAVSLFAAILWIGLQGNQPHAAEDAKPIMQKWEYHLEFGIGGDSAASLNKLGADGWEMCGLTTSSSTITVAAFKRPKR
jgi:hypothetical protein